MAKLWIIGAGPGAPDLITVRGREILARADAILYAGSLVDREHMAFAPPACEIVDSSSMTLESMVAWLRDRCQRLPTVVRLQTGDPSLYGTLTELVVPLEEVGIEISVVPGVSSAMASAAVAVESLTQPEVTQTVIFTRTEGRTPMPEKERLRNLAQHGATLCVFLSATLIDKVVDELRLAGWSEQQPILVVHKATWAGEEKILRGSLANIAAMVRHADITSQAMIITGPAITARRGKNNPVSRLYADDFSHKFRQASILNSDKTPKG